MTLGELCEPIFSYVCRLNRLTRRGKGSRFIVPQIQGDIDDLFRRLTERAATEGLSSRFEKVRLPLVFFLDYVMANHPAKGDVAWPRLAHALTPPHLKGDEEFFTPMLEKALADPGPEAAEELEVFYNCMALGMEGKYKDRPQEISTLLSRLIMRLPGWRSEEDGRVCEEAYRQTVRGTVAQPVAAPLTLMWVAMACTLVVVVVVSGLIYRAQTRTLEKLVAPYQSAAATAAPAPAAAAH